MSEDRKIGFSVTAENDTKHAFDEIKRDAQGMAQAVFKAGNEASSGISKIGDGVEEAAQKLSRGESSLMGQLRRVSEQTQVAARSAQSMADAFDIKVDARGFDATKFAPMIAGLRDFESAISVAKAREMEFAAQNAFAKKAAQAQEMAKASQYTSWWAAELEKAEAAERRLASENTFIQSLRAQSEAIGKTRADLLEMQAAQMGVSTQAAPFIAKLRETEKGMGQLGVSAGQTRAALAQLPMQFSDIIVSLQGGQAPLTVFLQQGAQIKDSFGGAGAALKAMAGYVIGLVNPLTLAGAAAVGLGAAYYQGSKEQDAFTRSMVLTGNAAGVTSGQLREYARGIDSIVGTQAQAAAGLAAFINAGLKGGDELRRYTQTAIEWERATGEAVDNTAEKFVSLQKDPLAAVLKLNEGTNFLTVSVYEQIKALEEQGDKAGAAEVAMSSLDATMRERAQAIEESLGYIERAWRYIKDEAAGAWDAMLGVGRKKTNKDLLAQAEEELRSRQEKAPLVGDDEAWRKGNDRIAARIHALTDLINTEDVHALAQAESARQTQSLIDFDKKWAKALDGEKSLTEKLTAARNEAVAAGKSEADIKTVLAFVTEEHNKSQKKAKDGTKAYNRELEQQKSLMAELSGLSTTFYKDWGRLNKMYAQGRISLSGLEQEQAKLLAKQPAMVALAKEEAEINKTRAKAYEEEVKSQQKVLEQRQKSAAQVEESLRKFRDEEEGHILAAAAGITHAEAMAQLALARAEDNYQKALGSEADGETLLALQREVEARRALVAVMQQRGVREANAKATKDAAQEWDKTSKLIGDTLADYIMGGGKDAATYLKRLFATLVLQPVVNYGVQSLMGGGSGGSGGSLGGMPGGSLTDWSKLGGTAGDWLSDAGFNAIGNGFNGVGESLYNFGQTIKGVDAWLKDIPGMSGGIGSAAGYLGSIYALTQGQYGSGIGSAIGTAIMPGIGTMIGGALGGLVDDLFGSKFIPRIGGDVHYGSGGVIRGEGTPEIDRQDEFYKMLEPLALGIGQTLDSTARMFGLEAGHSLFLAFSMNAEKNDVFGQLQIRDASGEAIVDWAKFNAEWEGRLFSAGEEGTAEFMAALTEDVKFALLAMDLPGWSNQLIEAATDLDSLNQALQGVSAIKDSFDALGRSMEMFTGISGDLQTVLLETAGSMDALMAGANAFYQGFYSERERMDRANAQIAQSLSELGFEINPYSEGSKGAFKTLVEEAMASGQGELAAKLLAMSAAFAETADYGTKLFEEMAQAAQEAREAAQELAFANLEAAFGREQDYWQGIASASQEAVSALTSTLSLLTSNARALYGTVDSTQQMLAAQGMVYIEDALSAVRGGGSITDFDQLQDAISAARGGITGGSYASQFERERDALVLAGQLSELGDLTGEQLSIEERQLKNAEAQLDGLDQTLKYWRQLLDGNASQIDATLSIPRAIEQLARLMGLDVDGGLGSGAGGVGGAGGSGDDGGASFGGGSGSAGASKPADKYDALRNVFRHYYGTGDEYGLLSSAKANGYTLRDVTAVSAAMYPDIWGGSTYEQWLEVAKGVGLPAFAGGGMHSGGLRLVGERGWEVEATGPSRIWNQQQLGQALGGGNNAELMAGMLAEMRALRAEVAALKSSSERTANNTQGVPQMVDQIDTVASSGRVRVTS